jgi:hypothetical protein
MSNQQQHIKTLQQFQSILNLLLSLSLSALSSTSGLSSCGLFPSLLLLVGLLGGRVVISLLLGGPHLFDGNGVGPD